MTTIIRNDLASVITIAGVEFQPGEDRDLSEVLLPSEFFDAFVEPSGKTLVQALQDGDVAEPGVTYVAPVTPGDAARLSSVRSVINAIRSPPIGPGPQPVQIGAITPDPNFSFNIAVQAALGIVYRIGNTSSGYNYAGFASEETISAAGDFFEFASVRINTIQGFGLASEATLTGVGPNQNAVPTPGVFCTPPSNFFAYTGRDVMGYFKSNGLYTTGAQNGGALIQNNPSAAEQDESGVWSTGGRVRVGLDDQYHFYIAMWLPTGQVWQTLFRSTTPLPVQDYKFVWAGFYAGSVLSQLPNRVITPAPPGGFSNRAYIFPDGFNEFISIGAQPSLANVLNYGQPWSFGFQVGTKWNILDISEPRYTILKNGLNTFYIDAKSNPGGNTAPYLTAGTFRGGKNTWSQLNAGDNVLVQSNGTSIQYFVNGSQKWNSSITASVIANNSPSGVFTVGEAGPISSFLQGGIGNIWFLDRPLIGAEVSEAGIGGDPQAWSFYAELLAYFMLGEGGPAAFPNSIDLTGNLPDAVLQNGEDSDFRFY